MPATANRSLGAIKPLPNTCRGMIKKPAVAKPVLVRKFLREIDLFSFSSIFFCFFFMSQRFNYLLSFTYVALLWVLIAAHQYGLYISFLQFLDRKICCSCCQGHVGQRRIYAGC